MASVWIRTRKTRAGRPRFVVQYRAGGRTAKVVHAGVFPTRKLAKARHDLLLGELALGRVPHLHIDEPDTAAPTVAEILDAWLASRIDISANTRARHRSELERIRPRLGDHPAGELTPAHVAGFVADLVDAKYARSSIRKTLQTLAMSLDHARIDPNPVRDKQVRLPHAEPEELNPPTAEHVETVYRRIPANHRLALLFLDWSGARVSAIDHVVVGDYDQPRRRLRLRASTTKTRRPLWIELHPALADAIEATLPHPRFRDPEARLFADSGADALRTAIAKACAAAAIPLFSPHDLRHRRISLLHLRGVPWARIGEFVGQRNLSVTADVYTHVLVDETELDYDRLLASA
jgi:integrase